jgi:hypothetical protein
VYLSVEPGNWPMAGGQQDMVVVVKLDRWSKQEQSA